MRCLACNKRLNDKERTRKYASSGTFVDLCDRCFSTVADEIPDVEGDVPSDDGYDDDFFEGDEGNSYDKGFSSDDY